MKDTDNQLIETSSEAEWQEIADMIWPEALPGDTLDWLSLLSEEE